MMNINLYNRYANTAPKMTCFYGKEQYLAAQLTDAQICKLWDVDSIEEVDMAMVQSFIDSAKANGERKVEVKLSEYRYNPFNHKKSKVDIDELIEELEDDGYRIDCDMDFMYEYYVRKNGVKTVYADGHSIDYTDMMMYKLTIRW